MTTSPTTMTVVGGDLYRIAAKLYQDATQWVRIAQANNLSDPVLSGPVTLIIPAPNPSAGGGVPQV